MADFAGKPTKFAAWKQASSIDSVWSLWMDVKTWPEWDKWIQSAHLDGPMRVGAKGSIVDVNNKPYSFEVTEIKPLDSFVCEVKLPGGRMVMIKEIAEDYIRHQIKFLGISRSFYGALLGRPMMDLVGPSVDAIEDLASKKG